LLTGKGEGFVLVEGGAAVLALAQFELDVGSGLAHHDLEVIILQALADLVEDQEALVAHLTVLILQEVDYVLWHTHVQAGLDLV
jgi:hypothetical protein